MAKAVAKSKKIAAKSKPSTPVRGKAAPAATARKPLKKAPAKPVAKAAPKEPPKDDREEIIEEGKRGEMSWRYLKLKPVNVKGDSQTFEIQIPASVTDDVIWMIAELGKFLEQGHASLDLRYVNGRPALFLTARKTGFPFTVDPKKGTK